MEFFAGANTEKGFVSIFDRVLAEADRLRRAAELKLEDAAALVVERIVGS